MRAYGSSVLRAFAAQSLEEHPAAIAAYERVVAALPHDGESWNNLGNSRLHAGDVDGAVAAAAPGGDRGAGFPARTLEPGQHAGGWRIGSRRRGRIQGHGRRISPTIGGALRELYVLLRSQAREEEALEAIEEASRRNPDALDLLLAVASQRLLLLDNKGAELA